PPARTLLRRTARPCTSSCTSRCGRNGSTTPSATAPWGSSSPRDSPARRFGLARRSAGRSAENQHFLDGPVRPMLLFYRNRQRRSARFLRRRGRPFRGETKRGAKLLKTNDTEKTAKRNRKQSLENKR